MAACPADVPWQRVLNAKGEISLKGDAQRRLIAAEGVTFDVQGRVDFKYHGRSEVGATRQALLF